MTRHILLTILLALALVVTVSAVYEAVGEATSRGASDVREPLTLPGTPLVDRVGTLLASDYEPGGGVPTEAQARTAVVGALVAAQRGLAGTASWYCSASSACTRGYAPTDMVAAIDPTLGIGKAERLRVCHADACITVTVVDVCACRGQRVVDLTSGAFRRLAPLSAGVIPVTIAHGLAVAARPTLPATSTEETP